MAEEDGAWRRIENFERQPISRIFLREAMRAQKKQEGSVDSEDLEAAIFAAEKDNRAPSLMRSRKTGKRITVTGAGPRSNARTGGVGARTAMDTRSSIKTPGKTNKVVVNTSDGIMKTLTSSSNQGLGGFSASNFTGVENYVLEENSGLEKTTPSKHNFDQEITLKFLRDNPDYYAYVAAERAKHQEKLSIVEDFRNIQPVTFSDLKKQILKLMDGVLARPEEALLRNMEMEDRMRVFEREKVLTFLYWTEFLETDFNELSPAFGFSERIKRANSNDLNGFAMVTSFDFQGAKCVIAESSRAPAETYFCRNVGGRGLFYLLDHSTDKNAKDTLDAAFSKILLYLMSGGEGMIKRYAELV